jgi:hypothetical protein
MGENCMNPFTAIRDYFRWCRLWTIDYEGDWRTENERRWEGFCQWRKGELSQDMKAAVMEARLAIFFASFNAMIEALNTIFEGIHNAIAQVVEAIAPIVSGFANAIENAVVAINDNTEQPN